MPLLQGQPFKLIKDEPENSLIPSPIFKIPHTGEKFLCKSDYEDRLALYSQTIWTCQSTGKSGLTHEEAWTSELKAKQSINALIPSALQKPLLSLVHHSLSPLEQLIDAASILCYSQFHVGEEVFLNPKHILVRVLASKECPKQFSQSTSVPNGICPEESASAVNGSANGISKESPGASPGKENQAKDSISGRDEISNRKEMLPKLYDVLVLEDNTRVENIYSKQLQRPYKVPSKDQVRLFIRSSALRQRGSSCTPWVVSEELVKQYSIPNKLPTVFLSSPKPNQSGIKRKSQSPMGDISKRSKQELASSKTVAPLVLKSENYRKSIFNIVKSQAAAAAAAGQLAEKGLPIPIPKMSPGKPSFEQCSPDKNLLPLDDLKTELDSTSPQDPLTSPRSFSVTKHPLSMGKPKILPKSPNFSLPKGSPLGTGVPKRRGRPPLSKEEKERNKKMRQATLFELSKKTATECQGKLMKIKTSTNSLMPLPGTSSSYLTLSNPHINSPYKSPVKRATTPEAIMKLPFMRRFAHEHKTIKGVIGQFRRLSHTMDVVLSKLSSEQIEMIPDEIMKQDLLMRQKKVQDKKFIEKLTPEERKKYMKDRARTVALERWRERKLKNLKIEDKTLKDLLPLPPPKPVQTAKDLPNELFGDTVMIIEFIKCFRELLMGEEKFLISSQHLMDALSLESAGFKTFTDILCCLLPTIIHDDISKDCKELGVTIAGIPITYQTAPELARLCLRKDDKDEAFEYGAGEDSWQIGKEQVELCDELLDKLEKCEFWDLNFKEILAVMKALVHKVLATARLSVYVEEIEEKVLLTLREKRKFFKQIQKEKQIEYKKRKEQRQQNKEAKTNQPKKARGRPKGYSPKIAAMSMKEFLTKQKPDDEVNPIAAVHKRRLSAENLKKEKEEQKKLDRERLKQQEEDSKRNSMEKKYDDIVLKRDNLLRRQPIGYDRDHNRYWLFHSNTPGFFVEKGWVDQATIYNCSKKCTTPLNTPKKENDATNGATRMESSDEDEKPLAIVFSKEDEDDNTPLSSEKDEDDKPLAQIKSKLSLTPMKMTCRGRPPKEAYVLVDEDTQTFPTIGANQWYQYTSMEEVDALLASLSDKGHRESQLIAAISMNRERIQRYLAVKPEPYVPMEDAPDRLKQSLKEDIAQIERELIEGWLGGIADFDSWLNQVLESNDLSTLGSLLIDAQKQMQLKYLKGFMAPEKRHINADNPDAPPEYEDVEGNGVQRWRDAVKSCHTYSRLHVLVGLFDSCIKWEKSMATRKCKICRSKMKDDPLLMCDKCENSYHWYCLRPPLKEEPGEGWLCLACMPKKTRREEYQVSTNNEEDNDPEEKDDPTFALNSQGRLPSSRNKSRRIVAPKKMEKECVVCLGRVGLINCAQCSSAYHSECHNPPLTSRARKDWVCFTCTHPKKHTKVKASSAYENGEREVPAVANNRDVSAVSKGVVSPRVRNRSGRFVKGTLQYLSSSHDEEAQMDKFGRSIRGAKAKALESMSGELNDDSNRRSTRNVDNRKSYKDDSEGEDEEDDFEEGDQSDSQLEVVDGDNDEEEEGDEDEAGEVDEDEAGEVDEDEAGEVDEDEDEAGEGDEGEVDEDEVGEDEEGEGDEDEVGEDEEGEGDEIEAVDDDEESDEETNVKEESEDDSESNEQSS